MQIKKSKNNAFFEILMWSLIVFIAISGFVANCYFVMVPLSLRIVGWLILICVSFAIIMQTTIGSRLWKFLCDARAEMRRVVWPNRKETFQTTIMVIIVVLVFSIIMWCADSTLMWAISWLTGQRG